MTSTPSALLIVNSQLVSQPEVIAKLQDDLASFDVHQQLLERLVESAVTLPRNKYSKVIIADGILTNEVTDSLYESLQDGGLINGNIRSESKVPLVMAGFVDSGNGWVKTGITSTKNAPVAVKRNTSKPIGTKSSAIPSFKRAAEVQPDEGDDIVDDDIIDEDDLISGGGVTPAFNFPKKCDPGPGKKRRRACKDCTCGLREAEINEENMLKKNRSAIKLASDEMAEIDFTVPGKAVGGCGSCALGDAFRCDGCPYLGLPPFKPGEVVSVDQFGDDF